MTDESHPNSLARSKTYRLLLSNAQLQQILTAYTATRHGLSLDGSAQTEILTITNRHTGEIDQIRVELTIRELLN